MPDVAGALPNVQPLHPELVGWRKPNTTPEDAEFNIPEQACYSHTQEGGVNFTNLFAFAVDHVDSPKEWSFCDIQKCTPTEQVLWMQACQEELDALKHRGVYELISLPPGHKAIKN